MPIAGRNAWLTSEGGRGVEVSKVQHMEDGVWADGRGGPCNSFVFFTDPDGNDWAVQEKPGM